MVNGQKFKPLGVKKHVLEIANIKKENPNEQI